MKHITEMQRYQIEAYLKTQMKQKDIAVQLGVSTSTISRELSRNKTKIGKYSARHAHILTQERKERFYKNRTFTINEQRIVDCYLIKEQWSPEQIVGYCKRKNIPMVSIERIYQYIRKDKALGGDMYKNLRHKLKHRKRPVGGKQVAIKNRISIEERPEIINKKQRMGDWEIDTIIGKNQKGAIVTIVERVSNFFMMKKLENGRKAKALAKDVFFLLIPYKDQIKSITSDNGKEFSEHQQIAKDIETDFYFAHPYASWERGLNEYTNKLVRQYIPKKTDFNNITQAQIKEIQYKINRRPRKKLGYRSPFEIFNKFVNQKIAFDS